MMAVRTSPSSGETRQSQRVDAGEVGLRGGPVDKPDGLGPKRVQETGRARRCGDVPETGRAPGSPARVRRDRSTGQANVRLEVWVTIAEERQSNSDTVRGDGRGNPARDTGVVRGRGRVGAGIRGAASRAISANSERC